MKVGRESGRLFGCSLVVLWLFSSFHRRSSDRIEQLENENRQLKDRQPPVSASLPLRPGASIFHPSASAASAAPAAAPTATSTPMEGRAFGMAGAGPFPPSSGAVPFPPTSGADPFPSSSVRPRPVHGWTGIGINAPTARPPSAWFAGDEGDLRPMRNNSWGSTAPAGTARQAWSAPGRDEETRHRTADRRTVSRTLAEVNKVIKIKVSYTTDVVAFLTSLSDLESEIETSYPEESEMVKCKIALNCFEEKVRGEAKNVFLGFQAANVFDFGAFIAQTFRLLFPASKTTLKNSYKVLTQSYPHKLTVSEFAGRIRNVSRLLEYNLEDQKDKFKEGLTNPEVMKAMMGNDLDSLTFEGLVAQCIQVESNIASAKAASIKYASAIRQAFESDEETVYRVMGVPWSVYLKEAEKKGVANRCFQCFSDNHQANECRLKSCKFCDGETRKVNHFSLICKKAPRSLDKFLEARKGFKSRATSARIADDFVDFHFDDDEISD